MQFSLSLSSEPQDHYVPLAQAAEQAGFDAITLPDSICFAKETISKYPYNEDGSNDFLDGVPFMDPFIQIARLSAVTDSIRFTTAVVKLAVRQPVAVAKMLSSLAVVTNNRVTLGVGLSPWQEDFDAMQVPWPKRGKRMDEMLDIVRGLMTGEYFSYEGELLSIPEVKICPVPDTAVPILLGGHSKPALKRAALKGDGWVAAGASIEELEEMIQTMHKIRAENDLENTAFEIHSTGADAFTVDGVKRMRDVGVNLAYIGFHNIYEGKPDTRTLQQKIDAINGYANTIIKPSKA